MPAGGRAVDRGGGCRCIKAGCGGEGGVLCESKRSAGRFFWYESIIPPFSRRALQNPEITCFRMKRFI